jgi:hypothetical protein
MWEPPESKPVKTYVLKELDNAQKILHIHDWVELYLHKDRALQNRWAEAVTAQCWFKDKIILRALDDYCSTDDEIRPYAPFVVLREGMANKWRERFLRLQ